MDWDQTYHGYHPKHASPRRARADALRYPEVGRMIERLIALGATTPDNARAMQSLTPDEKSALEWLRTKGLAYEVARDLWWLHPWAWDHRFDNTLRQQVWIAVVTGALALVGLWLQYFSPR